MNCYDAKEKIGMYMDAVLDDAETEEMAEHLANCSACALLYTALKKVEVVFKTDFLPQPPPEYWNTLPQTVTHRLGLRKGRSVFKEVFGLIQNLLAPPTVKWGLAGAVVVMVLIFSLRSLFLPENEVSIIQPNLGVSENRTPQNPAIAQEPGIFQTAEFSQRRTEITLVPQTSVTGLPVASDYDESMKAGNVQSLPVRRQAFKPPQQNKVLYPTTEFSTDLFAKVDELEAEDAARWRVFALTLSGDARRTSTSADASRIDDPQNSFSQTLWIAQQSTAMDEKRNIWLSYIGREKDPTYRALGIYNLGLTLAKIAEDSKDPQKAKEAAAFFKEYEDLLKIHMGNERYLLKMKVFESLLNN